MNLARLTDDELRSLVRGLANYQPSATFTAKHSAAFWDAMEAHPDVHRELLRRTQEMESMQESATSYAITDERALDEVRALSPTRPIRPIREMFRRFYYWMTARSHDYGIADGCVYCGRSPRGRSLAVNPITLQRRFYETCGRNKCLTRLREWEAYADTRRRRAQYDWERQHPEEAKVLHLGHIPPQYPSISRSTLRAFLDSGADVATVDDSGHGVRALNSSIRTLGFHDECFAELRSGSTVLRRVPK